MEEGPRLKHLRQALHKMLQATIKNCSGIENVEQSFPFSLNSLQIQQIQELLNGELQSLYNEIQEPFEELLELKGIPAKLNEIDVFVKNKATAPERPNSNLTPEEIIKVNIIPAKLEALSSLRSQVELLEWQTNQRRAELASRREALSRRCEHLHDTQKLFNAAMEQVLVTKTSTLEMLVDRMVHQSVPVIFQND